MLVQGKIWGKTSPIFLKNNVEIHRVECSAGTFCSEHLHEHKFNLFFVESGKIEIVEWASDESVKSRVLSELQIATVKPQIYHQFKCIEDSVLYEVYWAEFDTYSDKMKFIDYSETTHPKKNIFNKDDTEFHRGSYWKDEVKRDGYVHMNSMFFVESGVVEISINKNDYDLVDKIELSHCQCTRVNPGESYEIKCLEDAVVYEFYWVELQERDIKRRSVGGVK